MQTAVLPQNRTRLDMHTQTHSLLPVEESVPCLAAFLLASPEEPAQKKAIADLKPATSQ